MDSLLIRYWFLTGGGYGIGVSAYSVDDAQTLIAGEESLRDLEILETIQNVDFRSLDQGHVIPNMGSPSLRGIWFPMVKPLY